MIAVLDSKVLPLAAKPIAEPAPPVSLPIMIISTNDNAGAVKFISVCEVSPNL